MPRSLNELVATMRQFVSRQRGATCGMSAEHGQLETQIAELNDAVGEAASVRYLDHGNTATIRIELDVRVENATLLR